MEYDPQVIEKVLQQGIAAHKDGNLQKAELFYRDILEIQPKHPEANHNLGVLAVLANKITIALPLFESALKANPNKNQFWISYIDTLIKENRLILAKQVLSRAKVKGLNNDQYVSLKLQLLSSTNNPKPPHSQCMKLLEYYKNGRYEDAEDIVFSIFKNFPNDIFSLKVFGAILRQTDRLSEALLVSEKTVKLDQQDYEAHFNLGNSFKELDKIEKAEICYRKATELNPNYAEAFLNLGNMLSEVNRLNEAEVNYTEAIRINENYKEALLNRGQIRFDKGEFDIALQDFELCNTEDSRARVLSTLYALGKIQDIYEKIKFHSTLDGQNIKVAALAAFISKKEKRYTANNFCNDPLKFIEISNISSHVKNSKDFIPKILKELLNVKTTWEPSEKSTHNGFQSSKNLFNKPSRNLYLLQSIIHKQLDLYFSRFQKESCGFIKKWPSKKNLFGWHVILKQLGYQTPHIHPSGWLSGVIYLKVVPSLGINEGAIEFSLNGSHFSDSHMPTLVHQPKTGDMVFFPSSLHHKTVPFTTNTERIIISFDLLPELSYQTIQSQ